MSTSVGSTTTFFVGGHYEVVVTDTGPQVNKYYFAGTQRIAMRKDTTLYYLLSDHLGSTSIVTDAAGNVVSQTRYKAWGEVRHQSGVTPTEYQFTSQYSYAAEFGLLFYNARWYDVSLGRFAQADSIIPPGVQGLDRYSYTNNNPIRYSDPTGHFSRDEIKKFLGVSNWSQVLTIFDNGSLNGRWGWLLILQKAEIGDRITITRGDMTITGEFALDQNENLIVSFTDENYFIDQEKAALLGDSFELSHETDLSELICSPYNCTAEEEFSTDAVIPVPPYMDNKPSNPQHKSVLEEVWDELFDDYNEQTPEANLPSGSHSGGFGGGSGGSAIDLMLVD